MTGALFVGRFQPMHNGHMAVIEELCKKHPEVYVVVGSANEYWTQKNPFTAAERMEMIGRALWVRGLGNVRMLKVEDFHDDVLWTSAIKRGASFDVVYSMNPWTAKCFRKNGVKVRKHLFFHEKTYSGRRIRKLIAEGKPWKDLVPMEIYEYIRSIGGEDRVRRLARGGLK